MRISSTERRKLLRPWQSPRQQVKGVEVRVSSAGAQERQRWERNLQSYDNELSFLRNAKLQEAFS